MKKLAPALCLGLCACEALSPNRAIIENRYRTVLGETAAQGQPIRLAITTAAVPDDGAGVAFTLLGDRAQAALIEQTKGKPPIKLTAAEKEAGAAQIRNTVKRRLIVSVLPEGFLPAGDRVDAIALEVALRQGPWRFTSWSQASNGEIVIEVGTLTGVTTTSIGLSSGLKVAKVLPDLAIEADRATSDTRAVSIRDTTNFDAAVTEDGKAWLIETAGWRQNLAHNLSIDVVAQTRDAPLDGAPAITIGPLYGAEGEINGPAKVRVKEATIFTPRSMLEPVCGEATLKYRLRRVVQGGATFTEADDDIQHVVGSATAKFLFSPPPFAPSYALQFGPRAITFRYGPGSPALARFESLAAATAARDWLARVQPSDGKLGDGAQLGYDVDGQFQALSGATATQLDVVTINSKSAMQAATYDPAVCSR